MKKIVLAQKGVGSLFGPSDQTLKFLESALNIKVDARGGDLVINGEEQDVETFERILGEYAALLGEGHQPSDRDLKLALKQIAEDKSYSLREHFRLGTIHAGGKKTVTARTANQLRYIQAMEQSDLVFAIGPAGTGKSFLAVAVALQMLMNKRINRIILTRPAVEAGEKLGFLPGDLQEKVDPYLRPLYDALYDLLDYERVERFLERRVIEIAPLAFMRGRAQPLDSLLMTPNGWRRMGEIKVGDFVVGSDGRPTEVLGVFPQGKKKVYRLTMTDGASTVACAEHLWRVKTMEDKRRNNPSRILETQAMIENFRRNHQHRYELPLLSAPVEFPHQAVPIEPYSLGLLLGDGCIFDKTSPTFATADAELVASLRIGLAGMDLQVRRKSAIDYVISNPHAGKGGNRLEMVRNPLSQELRGLQLAGTVLATKFIPERYLYNSAEIRIALLQGLLDTDGGPVTQKDRTCHIQYSTTSERLKDGLLFLVRSLGGVASWCKRKAEDRNPGFANGRPVPCRADVYVLNIRLPENIKPFRLKRKAEVYERAGGGRPMRFIKNIEYVGEAETQCICVAAPDSLYITDDFILTHNTLSDAFIILDEGQNATSEQMKMFLTRIGLDSKVVVTGDVTQIDLPQGKRSGLVEAQQLFVGIDGIEFVYFTEKDVVRHPIVKSIIRAYEGQTKKEMLD